MFLLSYFSSSVSPFSGSSPIIHELITNSPAEIDVLNLKLVTALHIAALEGQHEAVQQLLVLDANVNLKVSISLAIL